MPLNEEKEVEEVSKTLNIALPFGDMPLPLKIIALLTTVGGLSIVASLLADVFGSANVSFSLYLLRTITGFLMLLIGYGIIKKKIWALWLYGGVSLTSLLVNPLLSFIPVGITFYLYHEKNYFEQQTLEEVLLSLIKKLGLD